MINLVKIGLWGMFINWYPYNIMYGHFISRGTYVFFALVVLGLLGSGDIRFDRTIKSWIIYAVLALITAIFAVNTNYAVKSLVNFGIKIVVVFAISQVCVKEKSVLFAIRLLAGLALLSAGTAYLQMGSINKRLQLDSGANISINDFGSLMAYGCFAVIPLFKYSRIQSHFVRQGLTVAATFLLLIEMFISGSRKSLYAVIILYALLFLFVVRKEDMKINPSAILSSVVLIAVGYFVYTNFLEEYMMQTSMYSRIFGAKAKAAATSDGSRIWLYTTAIQHFFENPLWGIGFNNFKYVHGMYTHSTYADPLACTGVISVFYLVPIFRMLYKQFQYARYKIQYEFYDVFNTELLIFYISFLFIGVGIPYLYKEIPCIGFGLIIGWQQIYEQNYFTMVKNNGKTNKSSTNKQRLKKGWSAG